MVLSFAAVDFTLPNGRPLLRQVRFDLLGGQVLPLTGPSGSGKSTLLQLAAGLLSPTKGQIQVMGQLMDAESDARSSRLRNEHVGILFQDYNLLPALTVEENLLLRLTIARRKSNRRRLIEALERVAMGDSLKKPVRQLSGGQQQRVALARALITEPVLLLADEPSGNLDDLSTALILEALTAPTERATLVATHDARLLRHLPPACDICKWRGNAPAA